MSRFLPPGLGWCPSFADPRDYTLDHPDVREILAELHIGETKLPKSVDLQEFFSEVDDQGCLNSSCAFAVLGLIEYFEARSGEASPESSRLFLYQTALWLRGTGDDIGTDFRTTFKALHRFGAPPQRLWPYDPQRFRELPNNPFLFGFAHDYMHVKYVRLDAPAVVLHSEVDEVPKRPESKTAILKSLLSAGIPCVLGFPVPASISRDAAISNGRGGSLQGSGQAVIAIGYDDAIRIASYKGAILIRNSWGSRWGNNGYGWLPYRAVESQEAMELWMVASRKWTTNAANP